VEIPGGDKSGTQKRRKFYPLGKKLLLLVIILITRSLPLMHPGTELQARATAMKILIRSQ
jgi:hypothetical protein